jgi:integrase/recombinase XerD
MARQDARELTFSGITQLDRRHRQLGLIPSAPVAILDFSGKARSAGSADTLATCLEDFLADLNHLERLRPHTLRAYRYELAAAAADPRFQRPLPELDHKDLEAWLVRGKAATSTVGRRVATFRHLFAWAIRRGLRMQSPLVELAPLRGRRTLPRPIREQYEQRALDAAIASAPPPYRLMFTLLRETGMRAGEVLELRWGDVMLDPGREALRIREAKNGAERTVILGPTATPHSVRGLRAARRAHGRAATADHQVVFLSNRGTRVSYDALHYQWARVCQTAGLVDEAGAPRYTPHQLRHTRGSELIAQGQRVEIVQRVLGHRDIRSTLGYAELQDAQVRAALEGTAPR